MAKINIETVDGGIQVQMSGDPVRIIEALSIAIWSAARDCVRIVTMGDDAAELIVKTAIEMAKRAEPEAHQSEEA